MSHAQCLSSQATTKTVQSAGLGTGGAEARPALRGGPCRSGFHCLLARNGTARESHPLLSFRQVTLLEGPAFLLAVSGACGRVQCMQNDRAQILHQARCDDRYCSYQGRGGFQHHQKKREDDRQDRLKGRISGLQESEI